MKNIFENLDRDFLKIALKNNFKSGSCALVLIEVYPYVFIANTGDSRAIMSLRNGCEIKVLTKDHKPER